MAERKRAPIPRTFEEVKAVLPNFKETYINKPPVIGAGLGMERPLGVRRDLFSEFI